MVGGVRSAVVVLQSGVLCWGVLWVNRSGRGGGQLLWMATLCMSLQDTVRAYDLKENKLTGFPDCPQLPAGLAMAC